MPIAELHASVMGRIEGLLMGNLGGLPRVVALPPAPGWTAPLVGLAAGAFYAALFCGLPLLVTTPHPMLQALSLWGAIYLGFAVAAARLTSAAMLAQCRDRVVPDLGPAASAVIDATLAARFRADMIQGRALAIAAAAILASAFVLYGDLAALATADARGRPDVPLGQLGWWAAGYFVLYLTAARATDTGRFYGVFAEGLRTHPEQLFAADPAHALIVRHTAALGRIMLRFWFAIGLSVSTLLWFVGPLPHFVLLVVTVAGLFSLPFGTFVLLASESHLREAVRAGTETLLRRIEADAGGLFAVQETLDTAGWARFRELLALHRAAATAGEYRSILASVLSLVPLLTPLIGVVSNLSKIDDKALLKRAESLWHWLDGLFPG